MIAGALLLGCASHPDRAQTDHDVDETASDDQPPAHIRAWMDRLTVRHAYDPQTGFIVAREVIQLPAVLRDGPSLRDAVQQGEQSDRPVIVFATADRCAPCQQYKKDALNDAAVIAALSHASIIATHIEVDRAPDEAIETLGSVGVPMTYLLRDGAVVSTLRGQRSADDLLAWMQKELQ